MAGPGEDPQPRASATPVWHRQAGRRPTRLVGRAAELALIAEAGRAARVGTGSFVHLVGEAGIGKTSLLRAATDELVASGMAVRVAGTLDETDRQRPYALANELLGADYRARQDPVGDAVADVERLALADPVVLVADDLHWADGSSLGVLRAIARRTEALGVVLLTSSRPGGRSRALSMLDEVAATAGRRIALDPLATDEVIELARSFAGAAPGPRLRRLVAAAAGNPFLAAELMAGLVADGRLVVSGGEAELVGDRLPPSSIDRFARRVLGAIGEGELLLRAAAVFPGGFTPSELASLLRRPVDDVVRALLVAVDAGLVVQDGERLVYRHDLLRSAVLESTPDSIVDALERSAAEALIEASAAPERVASCLLRACDPLRAADRERLVAFARELAPRRPETAADLLARAMEGVASTDPASVPLTIELAWLLIAAGRAGEVPSLLARRFPPAEAVPLEVERLVGVASSLTARADPHRFGRFDVERLLAGSDPTDADRVDQVGELALYRVTSGDLPAARRLLSWVEAVPSPPSAFREATVAAVRSWLAAAEGSLEAAIHHARTSLDGVERDRTGRATPGTPTMALALALDQAANQGDALDLVRAAEDLPRLPRWTPPMLQLFAALALYRRGNWDDALAQADAAVLAAEENDLGLGRFYAHAVGALISTARGDQEAATRWLQRWRSADGHRGLGSGWALYAAGVVSEAEGRVETAAAMLERVSDGAIAIGAPVLLLNSAPDTVRLALATGRPALADRVAAALAGMVPRTATPVVHAVDAWVRGLLEDDPDRISMAGELLGSVHRRPEVARARHDAACGFARRGREAEARGAAREAFEIYDSLGASQLHRRLRAELRDAGLVVRPRRVVPRPAGGWAGLTPSEATIVACVGEGLTNVEIADRLFVSRRTVESHLARVYDKLGLATRSQLVAAAVRREPSELG